MDNRLIAYKDKYICGDCLDVLKEIPDGSIDFIMTSPPYANQIKDYGDVVKKVREAAYINSQRRLM